MGACSRVVMLAVLCVWPGAELHAQDARQRFAVEHADPVKAAAFSPDSRTILTGGHRNTLRLIDAANGKELRTFTGGPDRTESLSGDNSFVFSVAFSFDGRVAASGHGDGTVRIWDVASGLMLRILRGHKQTVRAVGFPPDGRAILSGGQDATMRHWELETGKVYGVYQGRVTVDRVAFMPHGRIGISSGFGEVRIWDLVNVKQLQMFSPWATAVAPNGRFVLVSGVAEPFTERAADGRWMVQGYRFEPRGRVEAYASSPDGRKLLMGAGGTPVLWNLPDAREIHRFEGHGRGLVQVVAFSQDGRSALSGGTDRTLRVWDVTGLQ